MIASPQIALRLCHRLSNVETMDSLARYAGTVDGWTQSGLGVTSSGHPGEQASSGNGRASGGLLHRLGVVLDADLTETQMRQVLGLNAARLMGLPVTPSALT